MGSEMCIRDSINSNMVNRDSEILVLTETVKCSKCNCDCHCESELHVPSDELDTGGPCGCDDCQCKKA